MQNSIQPKHYAVFILSAVAVTCFSLLPEAKAVVPAPDGGYPGGNTAEGQNALFSLTSGSFNTAVGYYSLRSDTTARLNTAVGAGALFANTSDQNTATGAGALFSNTTGAFNTADGAFALFANTTGLFNTATADCLYSNTTGNQNTATGAGALGLSTVGDNNTATGFQALGGNTTGSHNTAVGVGAGTFGTTGSGNVALGECAGANVTTGSNNIDIGNSGVNTDSNTIRIGTVVAGTNCQSVMQPVHTATYVAGIFGTTASGGVGVFINENGQLGTLTSSRRFKEEIKPMEEASEALFSLKPVSFRYKKEIDPGSTPQLGLVAEEVEKVNPDLVVRDNEGKPYSVRYDQVNAMMLNEFLKEHRKVGELQASLAQQQKDFQAIVRHQQKQIDALTAGLQKVSVQLEVGKPAQQTVLSNK